MFSRGVCNISKSVIFQLHHNAMILRMCYVFMLLAHMCGDGVTA